MIGAHAVAQTEAHRLIEQLMILTNERSPSTSNAQASDALPGPRAPDPAARRLA